MIQPLRTAHRWTFSALAIGLPTVLWIGLQAREAPLPQHNLIVEMPSKMYLLRQSDRLWSKHAIQSKFYGDSTNPEEIEVLLFPLMDLTDPDLLLYWTSGASAGGEMSQWKLLGSFAAGRVFSLPSEAKRGGHLLLYSLAHREVVDSAVVEKLP